MAYVRSGADGTQSSDGTTAAVNWTLNSGAAVTDGMLATSLTTRERTQTTTSLTYNAVSMTSLGARLVEGTTWKQTFRLVAPASGSNTLTLTPTAGSAGYQLNMQWALYDEVDQTTPVTASSYTTAQATSGGANTAAALNIANAAANDYLFVSVGTRSGGTITSTATGYTESQDTTDGSGTINQVSGYNDAASAGTNNTTSTFNNGAAIAWVGQGFAITPSAGGATAAMTGTAFTVPPFDRTAGQAGGKTLIATLTGDTFVASGATFDAQRQNIINGIDAGNATANGWDEVIKAGLPVTAVVRTSNTVVTVTLPAFPTYGPAATQTITVTLPATALTLAAPIVATPTLTTYTGPILTPTSGTTNASGVATTSAVSDYPLDTTAGAALKVTATVGDFTISTCTLIDTP